MTNTPYVTTVGLAMLEALKKVHQLQEEPEKSALKLTKSPKESGWNRSSVGGIPEPQAVMLLYKSPIDKIIAMVLLERAHGHPLEIEGFWHNKFCESAVMIDWLRRGIWPIDIGPEKYHDQAPSAAALTATMLTEHTLTEGEAELIKLANKNNKSGFLKSGKHSIALLLRHFYELEELDHELIIEETQCVLHAWIEARESEPEAQEAANQLLEEHFPEYATQKCPPISVGQYVRDMLIIGISPSEARRRAKWWLDHEDEVQAAKRRGQKQLEEAILDGKFKPFFICNFRTKTVEEDGRFTRWDEPLVGLVAECDDFWMIWALNKSGYAASLIRNPNKGYTVVSIHQKKARGRLNSQNLADFLQEQEPGVWYYHENMGKVMDGSVQYTENSTRTKISLERLKREIAKRLPAPKK